LPKTSHIDLLSPILFSFVQSFPSPPPLGLTVFFGRWLGSLLVASDSNLLEKCVLRDDCRTGVVSMGGVAEGDDELMDEECRSEGA